MPNALFHDHKNIDLYEYDKHLDRSGQLCFTVMFY